MPLILGLLLLAGGAGLAGWKLGQGQMSNDLNNLFNFGDTSGASLGNMNMNTLMMLMMMQGGGGGNNMLQMLLLMQMMGGANGTNPLVSQNNLLATNGLTETQQPTNFLAQLNASLGSFGESLKGITTSIIPQSVTKPILTSTPTLPVGSSIPFTSPDQVLPSGFYSWNSDTNSYTVQQSPSYDPQYM